MTLSTQLSDGDIPDGWSVSVDVEKQVNLLRSESLEGEGRRRSVMIRKHGGNAYNVKWLSRYGPDGCPLLAEGVSLSKAIRVAQAEARAVDAGYPSEGELTQSTDEAESDSNEGGEGGEESVKQPSLGDFA